jgi:hypothetical protein
MKPFSLLFGFGRVREEGCIMRPSDHDEAVNRARIFSGENDPDSRAQRVRNEYHAL